MILNQKETQIEQSCSIKKVKKLHRKVFDQLVSTAPKNKVIIHPRTRKEYWAGLEQQPRDSDHCEISSHVITILVSACTTVK